MNDLDLQTGALDAGSGWSADTEPADSPAQPSGPPTPVDMPQQAPAAATDADGHQDDDVQDDAEHDLQRARQLRSENRNLRARAKDAEASRDALAAEIDNYRRAEVERIAREVVQDPRDLLDRHPMTDFVIDGALSADAVRSAAQALVAERGHLAAEPVVTRPPSDRPIESLKPGGSPERPPQAATTWQQAIGLRS